VTDRRTDRIAISVSQISIAVLMGDKNMKYMETAALLI